MQEAARRCTRLSFTVFCQSGSDFLLSWVPERFVFNIVLVEPEIPPNTGNVGRLCLATGSTLHLVKPFGFRLDDKQLKRAGLDCWHEVALKTWGSFDELQHAQPDQTRYFFLTTKTDRAYFDVKFRPGDFLVFGRETKGLPENLLAEKQQDRSE